jgi:2-dehydro-3-deoxyphosphogluconate aldolase/(4S)-4-hydroxy-2-oxoglutarate aldolase
MTDLVAMLRVQKVLPILRVDTADAAENLVHALAAGGMRVIELTATIPEVHRVLQAFRRRQDLVVGLGTVETGQAGAQAIRAGARFLVTYRPAKDVAESARAGGVPCVLGAMTPSEVARCRDLGSTVVKIFPAHVVGPSYLASLKGPIPGVPFLPTGGIRLEDVPLWLKAGAVAVGVGGDLVGHPPWDAAALTAVETRSVAVLTSLGVKGMGEGAT